MIFVFGSNMSGYHGAGAARVAHKYHGAIYGIGEGHEGNSYALPTMGYKINHLPLNKVKDNIEKFKDYARKNPELRFKVTCVGCGLAGFRDDQIAPLFSDSPKNCYFDTKWKIYLGNDFEYWGTI